MWVRSFLLGGSLCLWLLEPSWAQRGGSGAEQPAPVVVTAVLESQLPLGKSFFGTTEPIRRTSIGSAVDGRVERVFFDEGEELLRLDAQDSSDAPKEPVTFDLVKLKTETINQELNAARAELKFRKLALDELKSSLPEEIAAAEQAGLAAEQTYGLAEKKFGRIRALYERQSGVTKDEYDEAASALEIARSNHEEAKSTLRRLQNTSEARVAQAEARVEIQDAEVKKLEDQLYKHTLRSPFPGYVISQQAEVGDWVSRGDVVAEVIQIDPIELRVFVPESDIYSLQRALAQAPDRVLGVSVSFEALSDERFEGRVERIIPQADVRSRAFPVLIRIDNPKQPNVGRRLGSGMLAKVTLPVGPAESRLLVPKDAIVLEDKSASVMVLRQGAGIDTTALKIPVKLGDAFGNLVAIDGDLEAGAKVIIEGNERVRPGQVLAVQREVEFAAPQSSGE